MSLWDANLSELAQACADAGHRPLDRDHVLTCAVDVCRELCEVYENTVTTEERDNEVAEVERERDEAQKEAELHRLAMRRVARAAGALQRTASGKGRGGGPAVAAAAKLLEVEAVDAWGRTREAEAQGGGQERERIELAAIELLTPEERAELARRTERARVDGEWARELYQAALSRLRASETARR